MLPWGKSCNKTLVVLESEDKLNGILGLNDGQA